MKRSAPSRQQKHLPKASGGFHNHSNLLTMRRRNEKRTTLWYGNQWVLFLKYFRFCFGRVEHNFLRAPLSSVREESLRFTVCIVSFDYTGELTDWYWARGKLKIKIMRFANSGNWDFKTFSLTLKGSYATETSLFTTFYDSLLIFRVCHSVSYHFIASVNLIKQIFRSPYI